MCECVCVCVRVCVCVVSQCLHVCLWCHSVYICVCEVEVGRSTGGELVIDALVCNWHIVQLHEFAYYYRFYLLSLSHPQPRATLMTDESTSCSQPTATLC